MTKSTPLFFRRALAATLLLLSSVSAFSQESNGWTDADRETLRYAFDRDFHGLAGACLSGFATRNQQQLDFFFSQYNCVTCENETKPMHILGSWPKIGDDGYPILNFNAPDAIFRKMVEYNKTQSVEGRKIKARGHVLVWHSQTSEWWFHEDYDVQKPYVDPETMLKRLDRYVKDVMEHYYGEGSEFRGLICAWDVVNEAIDDGTGQPRMNSSWHKIFQDDSYLREAFVIANKYVPAEVKLFYNDYNEIDPRKRDGICRLLRSIKEYPGARIDGMGMQTHANPGYPIDRFKESVRAYSEIVDEIQLTEIDLKTRFGYNVENKEAEYQFQAEKYGAIYRAVVDLVNEENIKITALVFWGTDDGHSWLNFFNMAGGGNRGSSPQAPLLFDSSYQPKPAFWAIVDPDGTHETRSE